MHGGIIRCRWSVSALQGADPGSVLYHLSFHLHVAGHRHHARGYLPQGESHTLAGCRYRGSAHCYPAALARDRSGRQSGKRLVVDRAGYSGTFRLGYSGLLYEVCQQHHGCGVDLRLDGYFRPRTHPCCMVYEPGCRYFLCCPDIGQYQPRLFRYPDPQLDRCPDAGLCLSVW